jgi:hypothetical protein
VEKISFYSSQALRFVNEEIHQRPLGRRACVRQSSSTGTKYLTRTPRTVVVLPEDRHMVRASYRILPQRACSATDCT